MPVNLYKQAKDVYRAVTLMRKQGADCDPYMADLAGLAYLGEGCNAVAWQCGSVAVKRARKLDTTYHFLVACQARLKALGTIHHKDMDGLPEVLHIERSGAGYFAVMPVYVTMDDGGTEDELDSSYDLSTPAYESICDEVLGFRPRDLHPGNVMRCAERGQWLAVDPGLNSGRARSMRPGTDLLVAAIQKPRQAAWKAQQARYRG